MSYRDPHYQRNWARKRSGATSGSLACSETWLGRKWETICARLLGAEDCNAKRMGNPTDLIFNGQKIDVKVANIYKRKSHHGKPTNEQKISGWWAFNRNNPNSDFYLCICLVDGIPLKAYLIPNDSFPISGATIGWRTVKYKRFETDISRLADAMRPLGVN